METKPTQVSAKKYVCFPSLFAIFQKFQAKEEEIIEFYRRKFRKSHDLKWLDTSSQRLQNLHEETKELIYTWLQPLSISGRRDAISQFEVARGNRHTHPDLQILLGQIHGTHERKYTRTLGRIKLQHKINDVRVYKLFDAVHADSRPNRLNICIVGDITFQASIG